MPTLLESLQGRDLGDLLIIAELWGIAFDAPDVRTGLFRLVPAMLDRSLVQEIFYALPGDAREILEDLFHRGRQSWAAFTRQHGELRTMGPARRDRERPYLQPISPVEVLWYRGLIERAFFDTPAGAEEFAYIPDDLLALLPVEASQDIGKHGRPAYTTEFAYPISATDHLLDHACTLLAALRIGIIPLPTFESGSGSQGLPGLTSEILMGLLNTSGLIDQGGSPVIDASRAFLESPRPAAFVQLVQSWYCSDTFNELRLVPGLRAEGDWQNDPRRTRQVILGYLVNIPPGKWWSLRAFISSLRQQQPDIQRRAGEYDSWFIRDEQSGLFLRGFENWDRVEGELLRFLICGLLHWLGIVDLACSAQDTAPTAFRVTPWATDLLQGRPPEGVSAEEIIGIQARSDARLYVSPRLVRIARYQVARFCEWEKETSAAYVYRLTAASLERARKQGLTVGHLLALLHRHAATVPPNLVRAINRWEQSGSQARLEQMVVLRVGSSEVMQAVRNSRAARFLGEPLSPTAISVKPGAWQKILAILAELGYLGEARLDNELD